MTHAPAAAKAWAAFGEHINRALIVRVAIANAIGVVVVFVYLSMIAAGSTGLRTANDAISVAVVIAYILVLAPLRVRSARRNTEGVRAWFGAGREPTDAERASALKLPGRFAGEIFVGWVGAAIVFTVLNGVFLHAPVGRTIDIGATTLLGGMVTSALVYLLIERWSRPVFARAMAGTPARRPFTVGIRVRLLLAWVLGSGAILLSIALAPMGVVAGEHPDITRAALFLSIVGLVAGAALTIAAARSIADPIDSVRRGLRRVEQGDTDVEVPVDDSGDVGLLQAGFNQMVAELRERQRLQDLFGRHVGVEVARQAVERGVGLGGELRTVSSLFVDVVGSTRMAQERSPTEVVETLNALFTAVVLVAEQEGGWVNKFEGDAALCVFGAPGEQPDHAARALRAARSLDQRLAELAGNHPGLRAGIGVSTGEAVAGNIGSEQRYEYTVIGDPVNECARLTELAKSRPKPVLASGTAVQMAGEEAACWMPAGEELLRGRSAPTALFQPDGR